MSGWQSVENDVLFGIDVGCQVHINDLVDPQPLIIVPGTEQFYYADNPNRLLNFETAQEVELFCSARFNATFSSNLVLAQCVSGTTFMVEDGLYDFSELYCTGNVAHTARLTTKSCYINATLVEVGFVIGARFLNVMNVCYDEVLTIPIYSHYQFVPANTGYQSSVPRPSFIKGDFYKDRNIDNLYTGVTQRATVATILNSTEMSDFYLKDYSSSDYYLARGHLAAKVDFVYAPQQRATFYFVNVAPQWQTFNANNWERVEANTRDVIGKWNVKVDVYTGIYGVITLNDTEGVPHEIYLDADDEGNGRVPVPKIYYKIMYHKESRSGIALIGVNHPYVSLEEIQRDYMFCEDVSDQIDYLTWTKDDLAKGFSYACDVNEFARVVKHLPEMSINKLLLAEPVVETINNYSEEKLHRLSVDVGDAVVIIKENKCWYYGYNKKNRAVKGIFPKSYVRIVDFVLSNKNNEYVIRRSDIVVEITTILHDWKNWFKYFYLHKNPDFENIRQKMLELIRLRSQILSGNLPVDEMKEMKLKATSEIDIGNKILKLDMVVRDEYGNIINIDSTSTTQLYQLHLDATERIKRASVTNRINPTKTVISHSHNVLLSVTNFVSAVSADSEILFTLFDLEENRAISENYVVRWSKQGMMADLSQFNNLRCIFTDLSPQDLHRSKIYLVAYVVKVGELDYRKSNTTILSKRPSVISTNSNDASHMRRPFGIAALDLTQILKKNDSNQREHEMNFLLCDKENLDTTLKKVFAEGKVLKYDGKIHISMEILHGDIKQVKEDYPHLVLGNVTFARKMGFPEVIFPDDVRNDLYVTLMNGEFLKGLSKSNDKNIEISVVVCDEMGIQLSNVISLGAGINNTEVYKSVVYHHDDKPKWNESFKIKVPVDDFKMCHICFTFKHRSSNEAKDLAERPFALAYVKLMQHNETALQQKNHELIVYKIDYKKYDAENKLKYLQLPSHQSELVNGSNVKPSAPGFIISPKDSFVININLCSTKLTQDVNLLGLLKWSGEMQTLENSLCALLMVKEEEVVKFLHDILDVLFRILVENNDPQKFNDLVFKCLIRLIEIVYDLKYQHFQSVLDLYINESFSATLAYEKLINVIQVYVNYAIDNRTKEQKNETEDPLYKTTRILQYIMKFIIRSRVLFANLNDDTEKDAFEESIGKLLESFILLISCKDNLLRSQGALLKFLHIITSDLMQVYDPVRLSKFVVDIIKSIPAGRLNQSKMNCIKDIINSKLFKMPECRMILLPVFCRQIRDKLDKKEEGDNEIWLLEKNNQKIAKVLGVDKVQLNTRETSAKTKMQECVDIMNRILELIFRKDIGQVDDDISTVMSILLRTVIQSHIALGNTNPLNANLVAILLGIFRSMSAKHYQEYVQHFPTTFDLQDFLTEILLVFKNLVSSPVFDKDWMDMIMHQNTVILNSLRHFASIIMERFIKPFEIQVWSNFFHCSIAFLVQPALQLDQFTENKKSMILTRYEDIRREAANEITKMWFNLGEFKTKFVPQLVSSMLEMSMIKDTELRINTIPIFFDMMQCEYYSSRIIMESYGDTKYNSANTKCNFNEFEKEIIAKLDFLIASGNGDNDYKDLFYKIMVDLCRKHSTLKVEGTKFVEMAKDLMEKLLEYRLIRYDESKENRMACTYSLLQFYFNVNRKEMYINYVNKLCDLHRELDNHTEAAFTLKLHSDLLIWDDQPLSSALNPNYPNYKTHRQLKSLLYNEIIDLFDKGEMWEWALKMCKELAKQLEYEIYDYQSLSNLHMRMAQFYDQILKQMRHESEYFRVAFYGMKFPEFLRNKIFIYRGKAYEKLSAFSTRISQEHPQAEIMNTLSKPGNEITHSDSQYIQINGVEPIMNEEFAHLADREVCPNIVKHYLTNNVQKFRFSRKHRDSSSGANRDNVAYLWLERTVMETSDLLPGILRWFPVVSTKTYMISPIECAIESMQLANKQLRDLINQHKISATASVNPLGMKIKGIVDAAVNGGSKLYEDAFLKPEYLKENPNNKTQIDELKDLFASQIPLLEIAIAVHKSKVTKELMPFHLNLEENFVRMQTDIESKYGKKQSDIKFDRESFVVLRKQAHTMQNIAEMNNRLSETSMNSSDSGFSKSQGHLLESGTSSIMQSLKSFNFIPMGAVSRTTIHSSPSCKNKSKSGRKTPKKRNSFNKSHSENFSSPSSQWYASSPISPQLPEDDQVPLNTPPPTSAMPVVELTEELTPKRPLRAVFEREKRLSRPASIQSGKYVNNNGAESISDEGSNRHSIATTDSTTSEDDVIPPPLPMKTREGSDYSNLVSQSSTEPTTPIRITRPLLERQSNVAKAPLPTPDVDASDIVEVVNEVIYDVAKQRPPTPPPKPNRNSKRHTNPEQK